MSYSIPVLDFGSQTAQLIVRRVREQGVYSELLPHDTPESQVSALNPLGVILSGARPASTSLVPRRCPRGYSPPACPSSAFATVCS